MTYKEIQDLIKLVTKTDLAEFKMRQEDFEIVIRTKKFHKGDAQVSVGTTPVVTIPQHHVPSQVSSPPPVTEASVNPEAASESTTEAESVELLEVRSPIVGTFYRSPGPDKPPFKKVGDKVEAGETVCIVEAMKLFNEIESEISGKIVKVVVEDASPVEYDQVLFLVDPKG